MSTSSQPSDLVDPKDVLKIAAGQAARARLAYYEFRDLARERHGGTRADILVEDIKSHADSYVHTLEQLFSTLPTEYEPEWVHAFAKSSRYEDVGPAVIESVLAQDFARIQPFREAAGIPDDELRPLGPGIPKDPKLAMLWQDTVNYLTGPQPRQQVEVFTGADMCG